MGFVTSCSTSMHCLLVWCVVCPLIHRPQVTMKVGRPYSEWAVVQQACSNDELGYVKDIMFMAQAYPGYQHRHTNRDQSAAIHGARTYVFARQDSGKCTYRPGGAVPLPKVAPVPKEPPPPKKQRVEEVEEEEPEPLDKVSADPD